MATYRKRKRERGLCVYGGCNEITERWWCEKHKRRYPPKGDGIRTCLTDGCEVLVPKWKRFCEPHLLERQRVRNQMHARTTEQSATYAREYRQRRISAGICAIPGCKSDPAMTVNGNRQHTMCEEHRDARNAYARIYLALLRLNKVEEVNLDG